MSVWWIFFIHSVTAAGSTCNGNCPGDGCLTCYCGTEPNFIDIDEICKKHSWDESVCSCIVKKESEGNSNALNFNEADSSYDVGVFQINSVNWNRNSGKPPCDVTENLNWAIEIYKYGNNSFKFWTTNSQCVEEESWSITLELFLIFHFI